METFLVLGTSAGVILLAGYALAHAWRHVMRDDAPLPLYGMLRRTGITPLEASDELGMLALAQAARRCAFCSRGKECSRRLRSGAPLPADCPNAALFARVSRPAA